MRFERLPLIGRLYTRNSQRFPANVVYGNIVTGLPIPDGSCQGIYCSHVLEHLALDEGDIAFKNVFRYLKPGGTFRMVLPDLERLAQEYVTAKDVYAAHRFMKDSYLGLNSRPRTLGGILQMWLGNSRHLWMWDRQSLSEKLREHGFREIRRALFGDAEDKKFEEIEDMGRFAGCLAMQCRK